MLSFFFYFFFHDTATTEIYTLSLTTLFRSMLIHSRPAISHSPTERIFSGSLGRVFALLVCRIFSIFLRRSEEHTSELQSHSDLVCRLLLEKKKKIIEKNHFIVQSQAIQTQF